MVPNDCARDGAVVHAEIKGPYGNISPKDLTGCLGTAPVGALRQHGCKPAACHWGELPSLVNHPCHRIREMGTADPVHHYAAYRQFPFVAFAASFALD